MDKIVELPVDSFPEAGSLLVLSEFPMEQLTPADFFPDGVYPDDFGSTISEGSFYAWLAQEYEAADVPLGAPPLKFVSAPAPAPASAPASAPAPARPLSARDQIRDALESARAAQAETNRAQAAQLASLALAFDLAEANPRVYVTEVGMAQSDAVEVAVRAVAEDAALRLNVTTDYVRTQAYQAHVLAGSLPRLWATFQCGATGYTQARAAVELLTGITDPAAITYYDTELASVAPTLSPTAFRQKARTLAHRLLPEPPELRHTRALADRKVVIEPAADGMAWLHAYMSATDAIRIKARYDATAKRESKNAKTAAKKAGTPRSDCRTIDQHRVDIVVAWLAGDGNPRAAKVRPVVFIPLLGLLGQNNPGDAENAENAENADSADRVDTTGQPGDPHPPGQARPPSHDHYRQPTLADQPAHADQPGPTDHTRRRSQPAILQGYGPIDPVTAAQLFTDAPSFRRVATDPFTGEILSFDRTRYRPTKAQREWIAMKYGTCGTPGCTRLAASSDIDHLAEWARDNGLTNENNLIPLCPPDHRLKTHTRIRYTRDTDGSITVTTPTGVSRRNTPPAPLPENPPF